MKYNALLHGTPGAWDTMRKPHKGGGGTSTTNQEIPEELKPLATEYTKQAMALSNQPWQGYSGQRFADMNGLQGAGLGMAADRAMNGSAVMNAGQQNVMDTLNGNYLNGNPYLDQMFGNAANRITDAYSRGTAAQTDAAAARSRNYGGSAWQEQTQANQQGLGDSLSSLASNIYGQNYAQERQNQLSAWNAAPTYGNAAYQDASQLMNAGQMLQDQQQQGLDFGYEQFQDQQNLPYKNLAAMSGVFGTNLGGSSTTTTSGGGK